MVDPIDTIDYKRKSLSYLMDRLPVDVLTTVCSFLPWRDRLATRLLCSKFGSLQCPPVRIEVLTLQQGYDTCSFTLRFNEMDRRYIEIIRAEKRSDSKEFVFSRSPVRNMRKATISCARYRYHETVDIYTKFLLKHFSFGRLQLAYLCTPHLVRLSSFFARSSPNLDWSEVQLELYTRNCRVDEGERAFLDYCRNPGSFLFCPPLDYDPQADFWKFRVVRGAKRLAIRLGGILGSGQIVKGTVGIDLGIDDRLMRTMVKRGKYSFVSNTISTVTSGFLMKYIEKCLRGSHIMHCLLLNHGFTRQETEKIESFLLDHGFKKNEKDQFVALLEGETKKRHDPELLVVQLWPHSIQIVGDLAEYRGKRSCQNPFEATAVSS